MSVLSPGLSVSFIEERIAPLRQRLATHPLYAAIQTERHLRTFMGSHVYAVWDFMSLLKALQQRLTSVAVPWVPSAFPESRRFINEIVLGEESDLYEGRAVSHFEIYLDAMSEAGASTRAIEQTVDAAREGRLDLSGAPAAAKAFVEATFDVIRNGSLAAQVAAFTFGREDVIPDMFRELVRDVNQRQNGAWAKFVWYLERHIEVDGEDHGPLSLRMVSDICGDDAAAWEEAAAAAEQAVATRLELWDSVLAELQTSR
jgi:hypothetical protein